jgi:acetyl esterase/lipase
LRDEGAAYVEQLREAGVPVTHRRFAGQVHGFFVLVGILPGSVEGRAFVVDAIARGLAKEHSREGVVREAGR